MLHIARRTPTPKWNDALLFRQVGADAPGFAELTLFGEGMLPGLPDSALEKARLFVWVS